MFQCTDIIGSISAHQDDMSKGLQAIDYRLLEASRNNEMKFEYLLFWRHPGKDTSMSNDFVQQQTVVIDKVVVALKVVLFGYSWVSTAPVMHKLYFETTFLIDSLSIRGLVVNLTVICWSTLLQDHSSLGSAGSSNSKVGVLRRVKCKTEAT